MIYGARCDKCCFVFREEYQDRYGGAAQTMTEYRCRRFPPALLSAGVDNYSYKQRPIYQWPSVKHNDYCGEYKPAPAKVAPADG